MATAYTGKFGSRAELWKGGFGKLFRDPGRKITSPRRALLLRGGGTCFPSGKQGVRQTFPVWSRRECNCVLVRGTPPCIQRARATTIRGWMVNWLKTFSTRWLAPPTPTFQSNRFLARTSSFPRLKFSLSSSTYMDPPPPARSLSAPGRSLSLLSRHLFPPADPIHNTLSSFPPHHVHLRFPRSSFPRSRTLPLKARNFLHRETLSGTLHVTLLLRCLFD